MKVCRPLVFIGLFWSLLLNAAYAGDRPSVVFLEPDDSRFWALVSGFMHAVADDLELELEVVTDHERHRLSYLRLAEQVLARPSRPDYLVFMCKENVTARMLTLAHAAGVKVFTINTDIPAGAREEVGLPREHLDSWVGHLAPDNITAGRTLAQLLAQRASGLSTSENAGPPSMIGLSGTRDSSAAKDRDLGLMQEVDRNRAKLSQLVHADWNKDEAGAKSTVLLQRYPQTTAIWSASDGMALGAIEAAKRLGRTPGTDLFVGGVDWEPRALEAIRQGDLEVSLGRHFMGGGLLLMLLNDYHRGHDFALDTPVLSYQLEPATRANIARVERILDPLNWQRVDFNRFSMAASSERSAGGRSANELMDAITGALAAGSPAEQWAQKD